MFLQQLQAFALWLSCTKYKKKGFKVCQHRKPSIHKGRQKERKKETKDLQNNQKTNLKMAVASPYASIITLNINRLNSSIKDIN